MKWSEYLAGMYQFDKIKNVNYRSDHNRLLQVTS